MENSSVLKFVGVSLVYETQAVLSDVSFEAFPGDRWAVLGQNGAGKSSLFHVASARLRPSSGLATVLGEQLGRTDMRKLRKHIGISSSAIADQLPGNLSVKEVVETGLYGDLAPWWHTYQTDDQARAVNLLELAGVGNLSDRIFGTLSAGERQQVMIARALMPNPKLLLLDEPTSGLDMGAREHFLERLGSLLSAHEDLALFMITHHIEDVPVSTTHALVLKAGRVLAIGNAMEALTDESLSLAFDYPLKIENHSGRYRAVSRLAH